MANSPFDQTLNRVQPDSQLPAQVNIVGKRQSPQGGDEAILSGAEESKFSIDCTCFLWTLIDWQLSNQKTISHVKQSHSNGVADDIGSSGVFGYFFLMHKIDPPCS